MTALKELQATDELEQIWQESMENPVLLFKHSTTCPISAGAFKEYQSFLESASGDLYGYMVKVIESRNVSNKIADETNIKHESPQIFLIKNKKVLWNTSHSKITAGSIREALEQV
ncbi:bacillithiol system redox-active protein YtxJ [Virgibacillus siamensis]|uniref:bacillithiol system redox-active protein YtxJ n=1 Tax=Virgibacillus siamensis TaxID=480071 RepID=UPI000985F263|nr:bacillithiol system redox-active protein YtxJ [Virgibacillus siamensis]